MPTSRTITPLGKAKGFTLSELMIGVAILTAIAVFALPKLIQNFEDVRQKSILKETVTALNDVTAQLAMNGTTVTGLSFDAYRPLLNFQQINEGSNTETRAFVFSTKIQASSFEQPISSMAELIRVTYDTQVFNFIACYKSDGCSQSYLSSTFSTAATGIGNLRAGEFKITPTDAVAFRAIYQ